MKGEIAIVRTSSEVPAAYIMNLLVSYLMPGMKLSRPVYGQKGQMLINRGVELTPRYIEALQEHGVLAVAVESICDLDSQRAETALEESVLVRAAASFQNWIERNNDQSEIAEIVASVNSIVDETLSGKVPLARLAEISAADIYTFTHSIDVCAFSVYIGLKHGYKKDTLLDLGIGSILHDLGKVRLSPEVLNKPAKLTEDEFAEVKKHPLWGYTMLKESVSSQISDRALAIVLGHHERCDGSGYPRGIKADEIDDLTSICALADIYCAMTTERVYRDAFPPNEVYEMLMASGDRDIKYDLISLFSRCVCPFPAETLVRLNNGKVGCVTANNQNLPFRPVVTMIGTREEIDLSKELYLVVDRVLTQKEMQDVIMGARSETTAPSPLFRKTN